MIRRQGRGRSILSFLILTLAAGIGVCGVLGREPWLLAGAVLLAGISAVALSRAWRVHIVGTLLLCLGATTVTAAAVALLTAPQKDASSADEPDQPVDRLTNDILSALGSQEGDEELDWEEPSNLWSYLDGYTDAMRDLERGLLRLHTYGLPASWMDDYERVLLEDYNIESIMVAGCVVTTELVEHTRGYNEVMEAAIIERFGADVFDRARGRAIEEYRKGSADQIRLIHPSYLGGADDDELE